MKESTASLCVEARLSSASTNTTRASVFMRESCNGLMEEICTSTSLFTKKCISPYTAASTRGASSLSNVNTDHLAIDAILSARSHDRYVTARSAHDQLCREFVVCNKST
jgi:hypothetical protein